MATIEGTDNSENLPGTADADVINGYGGDDTLIGGSGNDTMLAGSGDDHFLIGGTDIGNDIFNGGDGADRIRLSSDLTVSSLLLDSAHVIGTEMLDFSYYDIQGTGGTDVFNLSGLTSTRNYGLIRLMDGNDSFTGYIGADYVDGGTGNDTLNGGAGNDTLIGSGGNDLLIGGSGDDSFRIGGTDIGTDRFDGGEGADEIRLTADVTVSRLMLTSANVIGTETLHMSYYDIQGTGANDVFNISGMTNVVNYGWIYMQDGADNFTGYAGADIVDGGAGRDTLNGGAGNDSLVGGTGDDVLIGGTGNDSFRIGGNDFGRDIYNGGEGADEIRLTSDVAVQRFVLTSANVIGTETLHFSYYDIAGTGAADLFNISGITTAVNYGWIYLHDGNDNFTGYAGSDFVDGGAGNDTLFGGAGNDSLAGGTGDDTLMGGTGNDVFLIGGNSFGSDIYNGGAGGDEIRLTADISVQRFVLTGANVVGTETLNMSYYDIAGTGAADVFNISGMAYVQNYGRIHLADGNDIFTGFAGADNVDGGAGNDTLIGGAGNDTLIGGSGVDTLTYAAATGGVTVNLATTVAQFIGGGQGSDALDGFEFVIGSNFADRLTGNASANLLNGGAGNDVLNGGVGNDTLNGGAGIDTATYAGAAAGVTVNLGLTGPQLVGGGMGRDLLIGVENVNGSNFADRLTGNAQANVLNAGAGNDVISGGLGNDTLFGAAGNDTLQGGAGDDLIWGQAGNDALSGGAGADHFAFTAGNGADRITDWQNGVDRIMIQGGAQFDSFADLNVTSVNGNAVVSFGGTSITFAGVAVGLIDASDFQFV